MKQTIVLIVLSLSGMFLFNNWWNNTITNQKERYVDLQTLHSDAGDVHLGHTLLWEIRKTLAAYCWIQAEVYFHGGLRHAHEECSHHPRDEQHEHHYIEPDYSVECDHHHGHDIPERTLLRPYVVSKEAIHSTDHVPQMMPWYWLTTLLDPYFIEAYHNGAYFLAFHLGSYHEAFDYLDRGLRYNPGNPRILTIYAWIYYRLEEYQRTLYYLQKVNLARLADDDDDIFSFKNFYHQLKADAYENLGQYNNALEVWEYIYEMTGRMAVKKHRIEPLIEKLAAEENNT